MTEDREPSADARALFSAWRVRVEAGEDLHVEALCREHPRCASELLHLHADWMLARSLAPETRPPDASLSAQLRALFGDGVDPGVCLDPSGERDASSTRLDSLKRRDDSSARYALREKVGQGGMGAVYRVFDQDLRRHLAMKVALDVDPARVARFLEEAQVNGQLDHPGIVPVHELGIDTNGRVFFTMKLVRGKTLDEVFDAVTAGTDGWNVTRAVALLLRICEAMAFAHEKGVVHRDLKPGNVMVGRFGEVYVMDWGLARVLTRDRGPEVASILPKDDESIIETDRRDSQRRAKDDPLLTRDGDIVGTPAYMAPEQAAGRLDAIGPQVDVYAVGAMLYRLLAGRSPYSDELALANGAEVLRRIFVGPPTPIAKLASNAPEELLAICSRAMRTDMAERYASMEALGADLRAYLENRVVSAHESGAVAELRKWVRRNRALAIAASLALVATIAGLGGAGFLEKKRRVEVEARSAEVALRKSEFDQLAGVVRLEDARRLESDLYPAWPDRLPAIEGWLEDVGSPLVHLIPRLEETLAGLERRGAPAGADDGIEATRFASDADRFLYTTLTRLLLDLRAFESTTLTDVQRRAAWARRIESLTLNHPSAGATWQEARAAIARADDVTASRRYAEVPIDLSPQMGLVPLGMNPATKLWEFLELRSACDSVSGVDPASIELPLHRSDGSLEVTESTGIVFVLVPGGTFLQGAQSVAVEGQNYDPAAESNESVAGEPVRVTLKPFFIARHELTQGQWLRLTGTNPSFWMAQAPSRMTLAAPVENVSLDDCLAMLARHGLTLPTEAQWEYACRGGTTTPYSFGADVSAMPLHGNVRDRAFFRVFADAAGTDVDDFDDGQALPCRVGSYVANGFGLHDVHGNVMEWCRDPITEYLTPSRPGDGLREVPGNKPVIVRGGCYGGRSVFGRAADRQWLPRETRTQDLGCRAVREVFDGDSRP